MTPVVLGRKRAAQLYEKWIESIVEKSADSLPDLIEHLHKHVGEALTEGVSTHVQPRRVGSAQGRAHFGRLCRSSVR